MTKFSALEKTYFPVVSCALQEGATFLLATHPVTRRCFPPGGGAPLLNMLLGFLSFPLEDIITLLERSAKTYPASPLPKLDFLCRTFRHGAHRQAEMVVAAATLSLQAANAVMPDAQGHDLLQQLFTTH